MLIFVMIALIWVFIRRDLRRHDRLRSEQIRSKITSNSENLAEYHTKLWDGDVSIGISVTMTEDEPNHSDQHKVITSPTSSVSPNIDLLPEESVRQYVQNQLTSTFGFSPQDIAIEIPIQLGSSAKRADIVVYKHGSPQRQENILIIVECKRADKPESKAAERQLKSYLAACINARFGILATAQWRVFEKLTGYHGFEFRDQ